MFGSPLTNIFALRCYFTEYPFKFLFVYAVMTTTIMGYMLLIVEGPVYYTNEAYRLSLNDFRFYENCVWNTFITMSTSNIENY